MLRKIAFVLSVWSHGQRPRNLGLMGQGVKNVERELSPGVHLIYPAAPRLHIAVSVNHTLCQTQRSNSLCMCSGGGGSGQKDTIMGHERKNLKLFHCETIL